MKKKIVIFSIIICIIILGIFIKSISLYSVRNMSEVRAGIIYKDENENVEATIFIILYNGTCGEKKVMFDVDGSEEYLKGYLEDEKYEIAEIIIVKGNGQVDMENMILTIPSREEVSLQITAQNIYVGNDYRGEAIYLRREAPKTSFFIID